MKIVNKQTKKVVFDSIKLKKQLSKKLDKIVLMLDKIDSEAMDCLSAKDAGKFQNGLTKLQEICWSAQKKRI